jgi:uncharacterized cupin superfamily protein
MKHIKNLERFPYISSIINNNYQYEQKKIGNGLNLDKIGCRVIKVPNGKKAFPKHAHLVNEELFFILEGKGKCIIGKETFSVKRGDFIACRPGMENVHQIYNDTDTDLIYLAISTMEDPDVCIYPDSNKFGVFVGSAPGGDKEKRSFSIVAKQDSGVDYWEGEK